MTRWSLHGFNTRCGGEEPPDAKRRMLASLESIIQLLPWSFPKDRNISSDRHHFWSMHSMVTYTVTVGVRKEFQDNWHL